MLLFTVLATCPVAALAVGFNDDDPPTPTETTKTCTDGQVWDAETESRVDPDKSSLNDTDRMNAVRGFVARKVGLTEDAYDWYTRAPLSEIRQSGGRSTWPELSLRMAFQSGSGSSY